MKQRGMDMIEDDKAPLAYQFRLRMGELLDMRWKTEPLKKTDVT